MGACQFGNEELFPQVLQLAESMQDEEALMEVLHRLVPFADSRDIDLPEKYRQRLYQLIDKYAFGGFDEKRDRTTNYFPSASPESQEPYIKKRIEEEQTRTDAKPFYQQTLWDIKNTNLSDSAKMAYCKDLYQRANALEDKYNQATATNIAATIDPDWAIQAIWKIIPDNRGVTGRYRHHDAKPPPFDAQEAIDWLYQWTTPKSHAPKQRLELNIAIWEFIPNAPEVDHDELYYKFSQELSRCEYYDQALGVADRIKHPLHKARAINLIRDGLTNRPRQNERAISFPLNKIAPTPSSFQT
ncbi:MAG: hypothetical protein ACKVH8_24630 [Pirellulales bacterium]|jgi:hypothetical protein